MVRMGQYRDWLNLDICYIMFGETQPHCLAGQCFVCCLCRNRVRKELCIFGKRSAYGQPGQGHDRNGTRKYKAFQFLQKHWERPVESSVPSEYPSFGSFRAVAVGNFRHKRKSSRPSVQSLLRQVNNLDSLEIVWRDVCWSLWYSGSLFAL